MLIVSDTSPIINLAAIDCLHLLPDLFNEVVIPEAVYQEIVLFGAGEPGAEEIKSAHWVKRMFVADQVFLSRLLHDLDPGEAEAIALAVDIKADYVLMDESMGRNIAISYNLQPLGVLGILLLAKQKGLVTAVKPLVDRLRTEAHFFIERKLYEYILNAASE